jgi:catechol 2,3-dioxygenase-like lactoylglutathione lyase family enzyme
MAGSTDSMVSVGYMVDDAEAAVSFYTSHLGFTLRSSAAPAFADVTRGNWRLLPAGPASSAGLAFRNDIVTGPCGRQILLDDPSGNPVELFQPAAP